MRITIGDVKNVLGVTETYDIVNAIRNSAGDNFQRYVPLASSDNIAEVGAGIMINQTVQNEFVTSLVDRIGLVVLRSVSLNNPLKKFKKGTMPLGRTIEEIFVDIAKAKKYDPEGAEETVFKREIPNVKTLFHERNRQDFYPQTIQDESLKTAFVSWGNFEGFISQVINAVYNSAEVDEYRYMMMLIDNYYSKGLFKVEVVDEPNNATNSNEFVKKLRATARKMTLPMGTRDYNSLGVMTKTDMSELHLLISADVESEIDVDVLAKAFNMDRANFLGHVTVIDHFGDENIKAVLIDRDWFMVYDNLLKMETIRNPKGLYWNYFYHVWQTLSISRFSNAVAFVSGDVPAVTQVIVSPTIATVRAGKDFQFESIVRATDGQDYDVTWDVVGSGSTIISGSSISEDGLLSVGENQEGELLVTATVDIGLGEDEELVVGESIVTVLPPRD